MLIRRLIVLLAVLLTGCATAPAPQPAAPSDPYALRATAQAAEALAGQVEGQARATQAAQEIFLRQTAEAVGIQATRQALHIESTRQALAVQEQSYQMTATAQAVERLAVQEEQARRREEMIQWVALVFLLLILLALGGALVALVWKAGNQWIEWQARRRQLIESRAGTLLLVAENGPPVRVEVIRPALPVGEGEERLEMKTETEPIPYWVGEKLVGFIPRQGRGREEGGRRLALRLLRESIGRVGGQSQRVPGWRELGWSAESWTQAVRLLSRYLETQPGKGTYLSGEYGSLQELYFAVGERRASLSPAPVEEG